MSDSSELETGSGARNGAGSNGGDSLSPAAPSAEPHPPAAAGPDQQPLRRAGGMDPALEEAPAPFLERRMPHSPFPAIEDYAFLSDCHTGALVARDGTVEWLCPPRFDSPSVFAAILDRAAGGWRFGPASMGEPVGRRYEPGTNIVETTWMTPTGWLIVRDALVIGRWRERAAGASTAHTRPPSDFDGHHVFVRTARCIHGTVQIEMICEPAFDYGRNPARWSRPDGSHAVADASDGETTMRLHSDVRMGIEGACARSRHRLNAGDGCFFALSWSSRLDGPTTFDEATEALDVTSEFWRTWLASGTFPDHRWREHLQRSALVLKGLTYAPTGAMVAAPTTSLPESPGGERNWDYRYTWMRDATFTLQGLHSLGLDWEADDFIQFVGDVERSKDGSLQIMYGIDGEAKVPERELDHLTGYEGAKPVRVGNDAYGQRQNDVYGAVLDSIYLHQKEYGHNSPRLWPVIEEQATCAMALWREPDQGIWECRGEPHHYVTSKVMCWVALDRAVRLAARRGFNDVADRWRATANEIHDDVLANGLDERGVFTQHYDTTALDASSLLIPLVRFLPQGDARVHDTVLAIADELTENGLVLRYRTVETDDGLDGTEGTFLICSFWLVSALIDVGERRRGRELCERLLKSVSPLGLYAEELDAATGRQLGNFPQAFTHLALINALSHAIRDEQAMPVL